MVYHALFKLRKAGMQFIKQSLINMVEQLETFGKLNMEFRDVKKLNLRRTMDSMKAKRQNN